MSTPRLPLVIRRIGQTRLSLKLPYARDNRHRIHNMLGDWIRPEYNRETKEWEIARTHFNTLVDALAEEYGTCDVILEFSTTQKCDRRCQTAEKDECECSCLGEHHGGGLYRGWIEVGETTLIAHDRQVRHLRVELR